MFHFDHTNKNIDQTSLRTVLKTMFGQTGQTAKLKTCCEDTYAL